MKRFAVLVLYVSFSWANKAQLMSLIAVSALGEEEVISTIKLKQKEAVPKRGLETDSRFMNWKDNEECVRWVNTVYDSLSLDERIGQCFMLAANTQGDKENMNYVLRMTAEHKCGGVIFFKGNPTAQASWTNRLQDSAEVPLLVAIDGEWGLAMRIDSTIQYPHQLTLGAIRDNSLIRKMGVQIGKECKRIGINIDFAPVVDVNNNPNNPVINDRSFGEDKFKVAVKGTEYMDGLQSEGILACAKHFPGHGDTDKDSHLGLPVINKTLEQFDSLELFPFKILFGNGVGSVMTAHLSLPQLDTSKIPGSMSQVVTTDLLKKQLGFEGLVFTDALNMKGASNSFETGTLDSMAFAAGNDVLEFSENAEMGIEKIKKALTDTILPMAILEQKVKKILAYKHLLGLNIKKRIKTDDLVEELNTTNSKLLRQELYNKAITIATREEGIIPLQKSFKRIATIAIHNKTTSDFQNHVEQFLETDKYFFKTENDSDYLSKTEEIATHDLVIIGIHGMSRFAAKNYGIAASTVNFIDSLSSKTRVIIVIFGSPYSLKFFEEQKNIIVAYEDNDATQIAAANTLMGGISSSGILPVTASQRFRAGVGYLSDSTMRLQIASPESANFRTEDLKEMDEIVLNGLIAHAFPGCQIAVVKDNKLIWNKAYGNKSYENEKVKTTDLYDIASITKIAATTLAVMKLYDERRLDINKTVGDYLSLDDSATIKPLIIADILTHQAGLKPFFEFFRTTIDSNYTRYYRPVANDTFSIQVASDIFIRNDYRDTMWRMMYTSVLKPDQGYVYSDIDFYILQKIVEHITQQSLDKYVNETFYQPMGLMRTTYKPLEKFNSGKIVPTENDKIFRKQTLQGFAHDPGAAMYGGVAGHAGLFTNAADLAQIMQLVLNRGVYNGKRFFSEETVSIFTKQHSDKSRRGLGFDKPEPDQKKKPNMWEGTPLAVFGHTGFTGTCVWADPTSRLTYVFLSNRVYPDAENPKLVRMNIRTDLQRIIYKAMSKKTIKD